MLLLNAISFLHLALLVQLGTLFMLSSTITLGKLYSLKNYIFLTEHTAHARVPEPMIDYQPPPSVQVSSQKIRCFISYFIELSTLWIFFETLHSVCL